MTEFCFSTPRIIMQRCFASMTTATPLGCRAVIKRVGDLRGELLLDLQAAREDIDDARDFREPDHFPVRDVSDMRFADKRQQMMFAHRVKLDVFDEHDLARIRMEDRLVDDLIQILPVAIGQKLKGPRRAAGVFSKPSRCGSSPTASSRSRGTSAPGWPAWRRRISGSRDAPLRRLQLAFVVLQRRC